MKKTEKRTETKTTRRPYCKPQLEQVRLIAEEAVLVSCKTTGGGNLGPDGTNCLPEGAAGEAACQNITS